MAKPNFLIVGAARSGTTSLYEYLKQHPEVFMPRSKEPSFFITKPAYGLESAIEKPEEYEALFSSVRNEKAIGEASTGYLYDQQAAKRIADYLGKNIKIIIMLRNPIDMAYSLWGFVAARGYESLPFLDAIKVAEDRLRDEDFKRSCINKIWIYSYAYIDRAKYSKQVKRFIKTFGREKVKVYIFEDFFSNPLESYRDVCKFLSISDDFYPDFKRYNPGGIFRSVLIHRIFSERMAWKEQLKIIIPNPFLDFAKRAMFNINRKDKKLELSLKDRRYILSLFQEDIAELEGVLGIPLKELWQ